MSETEPNQGIAAALGRIPQGFFILTAAFEERRTGMLVSWVQQASFEPPMVSMAIAKGRPIMPLISDSHCFGLCQLAKGDKVNLRKFTGQTEPGEDPFLGFELLQDTKIAVPILVGAMSYLECELITHMDIEGDHDLFVGRVVAGGVGKGEPHVHLRESGLKY
jgi:flavin reductase (DIM6/NTAB) family NADH-FMN oxidoreductase RutF